MQRKQPLQRSLLTRCILGGLLLTSCSWTPSTPNGTPSARFSRLAQNTPTWTEQAPLPEARYNLQATRVGEFVYTTGGFNDQAILANFERYHLPTGSWEVLSPMPQARYIHQAVALGTSLYVLGGYRVGASTQELLNGKIRAQGALGSMDRYDTESDQWEAPPDMLEARFMAMACAHQGKIYVAGGGGSERQLLSSFEVFDPQTQRWEKLPRMPRARAWGELLSDGRYLYAVGGMGLDKTYPTQIDRYDPISRQWQGNVLPELPTGRAGLSAVLENGSLIVAGGSSPAGFSSATERLDLQQGRWHKLPAFEPGRGGSDLLSTAQGLHLFGTDAWYTNSHLFLKH